MVWFELIINKILVSSIEFNLLKIYLGLDQNNVARIVNGSTVSPNEWPAQVFITIDGNLGTPSRNCSGTLIDPKSILVSGFCKKKITNYILIINYYI